MAAAAELGRSSGWVRAVLPLLELIATGYFRSEVRGMDKIPAGGVLIVSNHSGGLTAFDVPLIAVAFARQFGIDRPLYTLAHDVLFVPGAKQLFTKFGFVAAHPRNAVTVLRSGAATIVFPGGDWEVMRPSSADATIDFGGRTGYVRTALAAGVPIVPLVTIGGQETQLFITRGEGLVRLLGLDRLLRIKSAPITFGFPFGFTVGLPPNLPLPSKMVTEVLDPIDIRAEFGDDPDIEQIDTLVRKHMQHALDGLARERRFPVVG
ncbi:MAG: lysophospholipid acyltransferase family protein [Gordonia sp. (in: high G+C Gram-positive bacteria)]